jgi:hypothetical protein
VARCFGETISRDGGSRLSTTLRIDTMSTHTLHIENREAVNDRQSHSGRRWFVLRNEYGFSDRMIAIIKYRDGWTVYGPTTFVDGDKVADVRPDAITRLTFREAIRPVV